MRKIILTLSLTLSVFLSNAQLNWQKGGNTAAGGASSAIGTAAGWNAPLNLITNGVTRLRLNGTQTNNYFGYSHDVSGHLGIGLNNYFATNTPLTMLHLEGPSNVPQFTAGQFRHWMRTGMFARENSDAMYVGMKPEGSNRSDAIVSWSDDSGPADNLRFLFVTTLSGLPGPINPLLGNSQNGYEYMRMTPSGPANEAGFPSGHIGVGPLFTDVNRPQNRLHMNAESGLATFMQISNVAGAGLPGTGQTATDGLKLGLQNFLATNGNRQYGYLQWQENTPFIVQTASTGSGASTATGERLRITSIGALNNTEGGFGGSTGPANRTRIGISLDGTNPVTRPLSLLHLGFNTGQITPFSSGVDGWRPWMELGMFTSNRTDHVFIGLKPESGVNPYGVNDRMDAVLGWGDNGDTSSILGPPNAPDVMRFIFTATQTSTVDSPQSRSTNGLEVMRLYPERDTTTQLGGLTYGRVGVGDFTSQGVNEQPTHKLDVVGNGRFRYLPDSLYMADSSVTKIVMVDSDGVLRWKTSINSDFGAACSADSTTYFQEDRKATLNEHNFYFVGNSTDSLNNNVGFGWPCGTILKAKVDVVQHGISGLGGSFLTLRSAGATGARGMANGDGLGFGNYFGLIGSANGFNNNANYGVYSNAVAAPNNYAGYFNGDVQAGTLFISSDSILKQNVNQISSSLKLVSQLKPRTYFYKTNEYSQFNLNTTKQYGFIAQELATVFPELVKSSVQPGQMTPEGDFTGNSTTFLAVNYNGIIPLNTAAIIELNQKVDKATLSDQSIKTNVQDLNGSLNKVLTMRGVSYDWNHTVHPELNLDSTNHVGFIAQEIAQIDPRLTYLADDSLLHVEYDKVVPILAEAIQELNDSIGVRDSIISSLITENAAQQTTIDTLEAENETQQSTIEDLNNRLTQLENCLSGILPYLCQLSNSAIQANTPAAQEEVRKNLNVTLSNRNAIVLDQNVPNPFAEQTVINFSIPETVQKAQIHFYDGNGRFMNSVEVTERGLGSVTVFGSDLSTGVYTYTLVADGQVVATKKMMKQ